MGPIDRPAHISVFDRIVVDIIAVLPEIVFITNLVLPVATLPDTLFSFSLT